ncbi:hypothetical protein BRD20_06715 [Halobacteriales archaeon SW_8_65_20]|nr:MAG: hypothetical protein BRD20_06715 [Halobacteriales archaeon SW_8_65_20]
MGQPPSDSPSPSTGPPDRQILRLLERHLDAESLVSATTFEPTFHGPRLLRVEMDTEAYPESVTTARLDVRWFTTGDFSLHYVEAHEQGDRWECRWDRHPNPHNARLHFHQPPAGTAVTDLELPSTHPLELHSTVLTAIRRRIETLWQSD